MNKKKWTLDDYSTKSSMQRSKYEPEKDFIFHDQISKTLGLGKENQLINQMD